MWEHPNCFRTALTVWAALTTFWVAYKSEIYSHNSGGWKSKIRVLAFSHSGEGCFSSCRLLLTVYSCGRRAKELYETSLIRAQSCS